MSWTTPRTWADDEIVEAVDLNAHVRDNLTYLHSGRPVTAIAHNNGADYTPGASFADIDATDLSITISTTTGRVLVVASLLMYASIAASYLVYLDVAVDGVRQGGTDGVTAEFMSTGPQTSGIGFSLLITGLSTGSHTFKLQAKASGTGVIRSSSNGYCHFGVAEI